MSMEKYATYRVFKHKTTGELKRIAITEEAELEKIAAAFATSQWTEVHEDTEE